MSDSAGIFFSHATTRPSPTLISHWDGGEFFDITSNYLEGLAEEMVANAAIDKHYLLIDGMTGGVWPLDRGEPAILMVDFIRWLFRDVADKRVISSWFLVPTGEEYGTDYGIQGFAFQRYLDVAVADHQRACDTCIVGKEVKGARVELAHEPGRPTGTCDMCGAVYVVSDSEDHCPEEGVCILHCGCPKEVYEGDEDSVF